MSETVTIKLQSSKAWGGYYYEASFLSNNGLHRLTLLAKKRNTALDILKFKGDQDDVLIEKARSLWCFLKKEGFN